MGDYDKSLFQIINHTTDWAHQIHFSSQHVFNTVLNIGSSLVPMIAGLLLDSSLTDWLVPIGRLHWTLSYWSSMIAM